ncbi:MAG: sigma-70 family RNA polymerase sigma factor [Myxococcales bacterium]|nr:sigma-70 family RNA polymerase sigma factor [Myxococcales bacterium]
MELTSTEDPDADVISAFKAGDRKAFDTIIRRHQRGVWRVVQRTLRNEADTADVVQQAFVRALRALPGFRGAATLRSWLYRIAINCALSWLRDHKREVPTEPSELKGVDGEVPSAEPVGAQRLESRDRSESLRAAVARLPPKQKLVLELRVFDDLSFREVAELAECSENTAKVNFHYALKRLRELMAEPPGAWEPVAVAPAARMSYASKVRP